MSKPTIKYNPRGEDGNIFVILAKTREALRKQRRLQDYNDCWHAVQKCKSYEEALEIIRRYVNLVEVKSWDYGIIDLYHIYQKVS